MWTTEELINYINDCLSPIYKLVVCDIPVKYINNPRNITMSTKSIELIKLDNVDDVYTDWYYNEFNEEILREECHRMSVIDRDMEVSLAYEFRDISFKIINALNNK